MVQARTSAKEFFNADERLADLGLIAVPGAEELTAKIDRHLLRWAQEAGMDQDTFIIESECPRFSSGDGKGLIRSTVRGDDIDYDAAVGGIKVAKQHLKEVNARLKEEKKAKDEDILASLQMVNEMLQRGYEFLPIRIGKSRAKTYTVEDGKIRLPFMALKGLGDAAANTLEKATLEGQQYISAEDLQSACNAICATAKNEGHMEYGIVSNTIMDTLADIGALGDLPKSSQVTFF